MPEEKEELIDVEFECPMCGKSHFLENFPSSLFERVMNRRVTGEYIQDILKDYNPTDREKFITGYCEDCQKKIFGI